MQLSSKALQDHLPHYLNKSAREQIISGLGRVSEGAGEPLCVPKHLATSWQDMLQGDVWDGFSIHIASKGLLRAAKVIVLSNSCDIDPSNPRSYPARIVYAPLLDFAALSARIKQAATSGNSAIDQINAIKRQEATRFIYLPPDESSELDHAVCLDDVHSALIPDGNQLSSFTKISTLSNTGFYLLLFKLSVHFCRMGEKIDRNSI